MSVVDTTHGRKRPEASTSGGRQLPWLPDPKAGQDGHPPLQRPSATGRPQPHRDEPAGGDRGTGSRAASQARASHGAGEVDPQPQQQPAGESGLGGAPRPPRRSGRAPGADRTREPGAAPGTPRLEAGSATGPIAGRRGVARPRSLSGG